MKSPFEARAMSRFEQILCATTGVFAGSLLSDMVFGDGIQTEDIYQAAMVALIAALIQWWITKEQST
ncbi:MAG: hypothetical protein NT159_10675 [Proteobacteria bacterium]|nr:hypothetical protein [Pseudomonadota bacterium]